MLLRTFFLGGGVGWVGRDRLVRIGHVRYIFDIGHPYYGQLIDSCQNKVSADQYQVTISRAPLRAQVKSFGS